MNKSINPIVEQFSLRILLTLILEGLELNDSF